MELFLRSGGMGMMVLGGCKQSFVCVCVCACVCSPTLGKVKKAEETVHCREDRWPP